MFRILAGPRYQDRRKLNRFEFRVYSQNGEDGIIAEIFRRIGTTNRYFVELGSADGVENNTVFLLAQGWSGLWMDGDEDNVQTATAFIHEYVRNGEVRVLQAFITAENIEALFREFAVPEEFDLLSIDIDRNDAHVWEKIGSYRPRVVVIEYNPLFPPSTSWVVPYDPVATWDYSSHTGASLKALEELGSRKGYSLVGCNLAGTNAFFIRTEFARPHFAEPFTAENHYEPARYHLNRYDSNHPRRPAVATARRKYYG